MKSIITIVCLYTVPLLCFALAAYLHCQDKKAWWAFFGFAVIYIIALKVEIKDDNET